MPSLAARAMINGSHERHDMENLTGARTTPSSGSLKTSALASHSDRTPADGSAGLAHGGSGHAHTVNSCPTGAAGGSDLRDHAVRLRKWRRRHCLCRYCNRQGEASNSNQPDHHSAPLLTVQSLQLSRHGNGPALVFKQCPYRLTALVARSLDIDQGPDEDRAGTFSKTADTDHDTPSRWSVLIPTRNKVALARESIGLTKVAHVVPQSQRPGPQRGPASAPVLVGAGWIGIVTAAGSAVCAGTQE